jgi:nitroimidazol reductase NimA-like FMN-containing flavoprotein (pyridoxamine 5'-phosphate oxidase superfamily)
MPVTEQLDVPKEYGVAETTLPWERVSERLETAVRYWLATVRPDGRPHAVPLDGIWLDDAWYFGGSPATVKHRNLTRDPRAVLHLEDGTSAVIVEGTCEVIQADDALAQRLHESSKAKYGYAPPPSVYANGVWRLTPARALSWEQYPRDATRFVF